MTHEVDYSSLQIGHVRSTSYCTGTAKVACDACVVQKVRVKNHKAVGRSSTLNGQLARSRWASVSTS